MLNDAFRTFPKVYVSLPTQTVLKGALDLLDKAPSERGPQDLAQLAKMVKDVKALREVGLFFGFSL